MRTRRARGAATMELALAMLVLLPVLLYSLYSGEAFLAAMRAQEAEMMATWDLTAYLGHDYEVGYSGSDAEDHDGAFGLQRQLTAATGPRVMKAMAGLDSFGRSGSAPAKRRLVVAEQELTDVRCEPVDVRQYEGGRLLTFDGVGSKVRAYLHRGSYMACRAQVRFQSSFMPERLRDGVLSNVDLVHEGLRAGFRVCGLGRSLTGCGPDVRSADAEDPGFVVLTDDWALEDARASPVATADEARNRKYANVGKAVYLNTPTRLHPDDPLVDEGIGSKQVRESMAFLVNTDKDFGNTSEFKFGFVNPSRTPHRFDVDDSPMQSGPYGRDEGHLTPWDDVFSGEKSTNFSAGEVAQRDRHNYLGHTDASYNLP